MHLNSKILLLLVFIAFVTACEPANPKFAEKDAELRSDEPLTPEQEAFLNEYKAKHKKCNCLADNK